MKRFFLDLKKGNGRRAIVVVEFSTVYAWGDYANSFGAFNQNDLRRYLAALVRVEGPNVFDRLVIVRQGHEYSVWVHNGNGFARATYYGGIIAAYKKLRPKKKKRATA